MRKRINLIWVQGNPLLSREGLRTSSYTTTAEIRNIDSDKVYQFKTKLDEYLKQIPDQPTIVEEGRAAESNCLIHQIPQARLNLI